MHYETDERRRKMSRAIKNARDGRNIVDNSSRDSLIVNAYLNNTPPLHPRRTLDQFFYHGIDTSVRDTDQVVYRYCERHGVEPKVFMVDQLWLWIIGKGECFIPGYSGRAWLICLRSYYYMFPSALGPA